MDERDNISDKKTSILDEVRSTCKAAAERARYIRINYEKIPEYVPQLMLRAGRVPEIDPDRHYMEHGEDTTAFFVILDSINFGSGYFPHLRKRPGMSGYFTIASSMNDYFKKNGPLTPQELVIMTPGRIAEITGQHPAKEPVRELMQLFADALSDLGRYVIERFDGKFTGLIESANNSAEQLVRIMRKMPFYDDIEPYGDLNVCFFKRAQLLAADLHLAFGGEGPEKFNDLDRMTIFADNLIPHVLRLDNVLIYDSGLERRIDAGELIPPRSQEEVEIRACAVHSVELMAEALRKEGHAVTAMEMDYILWNTGQAPRYKQAKPRHRTRTVFY